MAQEHIQQPIYFTVATLLIAQDRECLLFNDGHCEVRHPLFDFEPEGSTPTPYVYSKEQMRAARKWLNSPEIVHILEEQ